MRGTDYDLGAASVALLFVAVLVFASPLTEWWMARTPPWWLIYLCWLALIVPVMWLARRLRRHDA